VPYFFQFMYCRTRRRDGSESAGISGSLSRKRRSIARYVKKNRFVSLSQDSDSIHPHKRRNKRFSDEDDELDISQLGDRASKYSQLFNNATFTDNNTSMPPLTSADESELEPYDAAIVYDKTELVITNLKHFQEYSIEVSF